MQGHRLLQTGQRTVITSVLVRMCFVELVGYSLQEHGQESREEAVACVSSWPHVLPIPCLGAWG